MRSYENSGYNPYNDNYRTESRGSSGNSFSDNLNSSSSDYRNRANRTGSTLGSGRDYSSGSGYGSGSTYGRSTGYSGSSYGSGSNYGTSGYGSSGYGSSSNYGSSNYNRNLGTTGSRYGSDYDRSGRDSWDRAGDRIENAWDRTKNRVSNAWDRMTDDDDYRSRGSYNSGYSSDSNYGNRYGSSNYGSTGYGSGSSNYGTTNYGRGTSYGSMSTGSTGYGTSNYDRGSTYGSSNYGSGSSYDRDRNMSDYSRGYRDRDEDRGFFERAGDEIKSWFGDEEAERRRRMDEMRDREHDSDYNRYGSSRSTSSGTYSGPPYSYGSSSRRDYEW